MPSLRHSAIFAIARKEYLKIRRDRRTLAYIIVLPLFMLLLYGFGIRFDVTSVTAAILDYDRSQASRDFLERFFTSGYFVRVVDANSYTQLEDYLNSGRARLGVVIPPDFGRKITLREKTRVQVLVDGTDSNTASIALGYFTSISQTYSVELILDRLRQITYPPLFDIPAVKVCLLYTSDAADE